MTHETVFTDARVVLRDRVIDGTVIVAGGVIAAVEEGRTRAAGATTLDGDLLLPGLVELHTDNMEKHFAPRPGVHWPGREAAIAHDAQLATSGITTVFDAICLGDLFRTSNRVRDLDRMAEALDEGARLGLFRAEHRLHLRCELSYDGVVELFDTHADNAMLGLVSLMDHTPGQRQFTDYRKYREYYQKKYSLSDDELEQFTASQRRAHEEYSAQHRAVLVARARARNLPLASHDDATEDHVDEAAREGAVIAEFPTTIDAARAGRSRGLSVLMGAPNLVLGGSHSGNVSAASLAGAGLLDILSSDYVPASLLAGLFRLSGDDAAHLPATVALATLNPARAAGLHDRGEISLGKRADLVRVKVQNGMPLVTSVWREGRRVA